MTTPGDDPYESAIFEGEIEATKELRRSLTGGSFSVSGSFSVEWTEDQDGAVAAWLTGMTLPAPGYREIANAGGIRWHERIEPDGD